MIYLLLCIICSGLLVVLFKVFQRLNIDVFPSIVVNYLSASAFAYLYMSNKAEVLTVNMLHEPWLPFAIFLGSLFITIFNITSVTTLRYGVSTASVAMKLGLVFPVALAFLVYGEPFSWLKLIGIALALAAVILSSVKEDNAVTHHQGLAVLPILVFLGSGACDSLTQLANKKFVTENSSEVFSLFLFLAAAFWGCVALAYLMFSKKKSIKLNSIIGGIVLGIINYFSFLFLLKALSQVKGGSGVVFPMANLGTVAFATVIGVLFFNEKISRLNALGLALMALAMIAMVFA